MPVSDVCMFKRTPQNKLTHRFETPGDRATGPYGPRLYMHRGERCVGCGHLLPRPDALARPGAGPQSPRSDRSRGLNTFGVFLNIQTSLTDILKLGLRWLLISGRGTKAYEKVTCNISRTRRYLAGHKLNPNHDLKRR